MSSTALEDPLLKGSEEEAQTRELFVQLGLEFQAQFHCIEHEVGRTQALLEGAITTLTRSFTAVQEVLETLPTLSGPNEPGSESLETLHNVLVDDLNAAVRSLQFQDMTHQLLDHVTRRVADMSELLNEIVEASVTRPEFGEFLRVGREAVLRHEITAEERGVGPVSQGQCEAGDIELF